MKTVTPVGTETVTPVVTRTHGTETRRAKWHARPLWNVIADRDLKHQDFRVFCALALAERDGRCEIGYRELSKLCNIPAPKLAPSLAKLEQLGYIEQGKSGVQRKAYRIIAGLYRYEPATAKRPKCAKCGKARKLNKAAFCRACTQVVNAEHGMVSGPRRLMERRSA